MRLGLEEKILHTAIEIYPKPTQRSKTNCWNFDLFKDIDLQDTGPAFHPGCIESVAPGPRELRRALVCLRVAGCCVNVFVDDEDKDVKEQ